MKPVYYICPCCGQDFEISKPLFGKLCIDPLFFPHGRFKDDDESIYAVADEQGYVFGVVNDVNKESAEEDGE